MVSSPSPSPSPSPPPSLLPLPPPSRLSASPSLSPNHKPLLLPPPESTALSPPKKSPPFPWTHQETLALIQAYQEKWYSLKKGQLKAFQWEEVAVTVAARCGFDEPSKTATQCRHKIEKLRKRYRSELQKPYPNSWQYFEYLDQMERSPMPLNARPIAVVKSSTNAATSNGNNNNSFNHGYGSLNTNSADYYNNNHPAGVSDESDEEWNAGGYGAEAMAKSRSKRINNIVRNNAKNRIGNGNTAMERGFSGSRVLRDAMYGKRKQSYGGDDSDDNDDDSLKDLEEERVHAEEGDDRGGTELATEIRGFAETFIRMKNKKIETMREIEKHRMEMEKKRMDMILEAQKKIIDTIGRAFGAHKKVKMDQET